MINQIINKYYKPKISFQYFFNESYNFCNAMIEKETASICIEQLNLR